MNLNKIRVFITLLVVISLVVGCKATDNPVADYLKNAELQYEGKIQKENLVNALKDILDLSEEQLKIKMYKDFDGKENQWDLPTLINNHFVPDRSDKTLGNRFYHDVKLNDAQKEVKLILKQIEEN